MQPSIHTARGRAPTCLFLAVVAAATTLFVGRSAEAADPRPLPGAARSRAIVDHAVVPAGGAHCRHCGVGACPLHGGHLAACRDGLCAPHCPVRPAEYGFYRTEWRRWPGQGVMRTSATDAATPVSPPASQVPTVEEESPRPPADESAVPAGDAASPAAEETPPAPAPEGRKDNALPTDPFPEAAAATEPAPKEPAAVSPGTPVPPTPPGEPPVVPEPTDEEAGLFDRSESPLPEPEAPVASGAMRYPAQVGRSVAAGVAPWKLVPAARQRAADSVRGL